MSLVFSIWTVVVMVVFIGIVIWAWSGRNKDKYEAAARMPLEEDDDAPLQENNEDVNNA